jgi:prepilin-type processing-associated H-X9-DG protein
MSGRAVPSGRPALVGTNVSANLLWADGHADRVPKLQSRFRFSVTLGKASALPDDDLWRGAGSPAALPRRGIVDDTLAYTDSFTGKPRPGIPEGSLRIRRDLSIGYLGRDAEHVELHFQEWLTFPCCTPPEPGVA